jgi:hypothetical protein
LGFAKDKKASPSIHAQRKGQPAPLQHEEE